MGPGPPDPGVNRRSTLGALICVCLLSVGSHFGAYLLGPLKSRLHRDLGTSNSQFSLLIASFNLNSTWTPLVGGILVSRFGTAPSSIVTTGCVLLGQLILLLGVATSHLVLMSIGLFIFGLGLTPLMVVQETLLSHLSASHHLGFSLALGLVSGKSASFLSSIVSLPLADKYGDTAPFIVAVALCIVSFVINLIRLGGHHPARNVSWPGIDVFGDVYWVYIFLNLLAGSIWQPFLHLSADLIQHRYSVSEQIASYQASVLLAGAIVLYPIIGRLTDSASNRTIPLIITSSILTLSGYTYLSIPFSTPWPGMVLFALGHGSATLLLVILVPRILPSHLVPLGLGLHKSMEMASSSLSQTLAGVWLDHAKVKDPTERMGGQVLLRTFWLINLLQLACALGLWRFDGWKRKQAYAPIPLEGDGQAEDEDECDSPVPLDDGTTGTSQRLQERARSVLFFSCCIGFVAIVWIVFLSIAWRDL
ncbi:major facilitator superfamily domain-containing protein [Kockovaella imperatae]|uniref:Lysosomal dipeptide transporter MFSD1 n=1 Tax=Kockovaella imperatae TaxID=4999 RepID=A0A1Y1U7J8_9TREE|nr:major facilitator superfamily domain-containing protein [Kockovaella imperatae]ORX33514.1 major facilitator superfamily domain-containing protein [Kockovaella imperatae]